MARCGNYLAGNKLLAGFALLQQDVVPVGGQVGSELLVPMILTVSFQAMAFGRRQRVLVFELPFQRRTLLRYIRRKKECVELVPTRRLRTRRNRACNRIEIDLQPVPRFALRWPAFPGLI